MAQHIARYRSLSSWLKERFGEPVRKITLDAGLGCPNRDNVISSRGCIYCNARGSGTGDHDRGISVAEQVDRGIVFLSRRYRCRKFIAYFQSFTNTYGALSHLADLYGQALKRREVVGIAVGTRPDCAPDDVLDLLARLGDERFVWVEYGLQSVHKRTLKLINRGHGPEAFFDAVARTRRRNMRVVVHLILGLPGESRDDMVETARAVGETGVWGVKLHPLYVVQGTELHNMLREGRYQPLTEDEAIEATLAVLEVLPPDMVVHRMTSDPHPEELVAPQWMLDRGGVRNRLEKAMEACDLRQGSTFGPKGPPQLGRMG